MTKVLELKWETAWMMMMFKDYKDIFLTLSESSFLVSNDVSLDSELINSAAIL
jgi:hypothetical protein